MTPPTTARRLVLVPVTPRPDRTDAAVRRFRLARLRLEGREGSRESRRDVLERA